MAIQYYMRAFNTTLVQYVDWVVNDTPDSIGTFSGYPTNQLIDITVNRVVTSKVDNFLKTNQSLGGADGYYFHVNSYDWRNAVSPISPPDGYRGIAVERGMISVVSITTASNQTPIRITSSSPHGLTDGQIVTITGVTGNVAANGTWPIVLVSGTQFDLVGSSGTGAYVSGGVIFSPRNMSTLTWDENNNRWRFVLNTNGDGVTLGASQDVVMNNLFLDGYLALGTDPADSGIVRLPNNQFIKSENATSPSQTDPSNDIQLIGADNLNRIKLGSVVGDLIYTPGSFDVDGYIVHDGTGTNAALSGFIREQNNTTIIAFRTASGLADVAALSSNGTNNVILGDAVNAGILYNTATGNLHQFQVNTAPQVEIGTAFIRFTQPVNTPLITQTDALAAASGQTLTIRSQNAGAGSGTGGFLNLNSGTSGSGGSAHGNINLKLGSEAFFKATFFPTTNAGTDSNTILLNANLLRFGSNQTVATQTNPIIRQDDTSTASTTGQILTIQSQNTTGATSTGGALNLTSGTGTTTSGRVNVQTGGTTQIIVSPTTIAPGGQVATNGSVIILGNLEVVGTTTTVDSTVVDIIGRVIHANWADPVASPNVAVPSQIVGYSIHRGNSSGFARDGAAWIWTEGAQNNGSDGYWRAQTNPGDGYGTDNFTAANSTNSVGVMANNFVAATDPNPVAGTLPAQGGVRSPNNTSVLVSRNRGVLTTIATGSNLATLPQATINVVSTTGFNSGGGTLFIFSDAGAQTVTYTATTGTSFTGCSGGTGLLHTGSYVALTHQTTTIAAPSNAVSLPQSTINVASTAGFSSTGGTIRVVTSASGSNGNTLTVQTVTYTSTTGTTFTGCTGGTGTMFTGNSVSGLPVVGTADLVIASTDFGNRAVWGSPSNLNGHIFNTPTSTFYEMQVNSVDQIRIGQADIEADGYAEVLEIGPTISSPRIYQLARPDTGANAGFNLMLQAQNGQNQSGSPNNNGGNLVLASGAAGTGGTTPASNGSVDIYSGLNTIKARFFPTFAASAADSNTMLIEESIIRVGPTQNVPLIRQDSTTNASGQSFTLQAQNAVTTGGPLLLQGGTGATNDGYINLITGSTVKVTIFPTTAISAANNNSILMFENLVRFDTAQVTPRIRQDDKTANGGTGETLTIQAQNETGTTSIGGNLNLSSGTGTSTNGTINLQVGGTTAVTFNNVDSDASGFSEVITIASTITAPRIFQAATGGATGTILALMAQNAATTGGPLQLHSGTGATNDGYINLTTGTTVKMTIYPTTATVAANNNSILLFENKVRFDTAQVTPLIRQDDVVTASATGQSLTIQAQNATGTTSLGGDGYFTSGTGTTQAGNIHLQTGGVDKVIVHPSFTEFRDTAEALRITPVSAGTTTVQFASTVTAATIKQGDLTTASGTGAVMTVQAQNETGTTSTGGDLNLTSGTGTSLDGYLNLQAGGSTVVKVHTNKISFLKGWRRHVTNVTTTYQVLVTDDYLAITALAAPYTVTLPASPVDGDTYTVKDTTGNAGTNTLTISGNGNNIDGSASFAINQAYAAATFTFAGGQWSVS